MKTLLTGAAILVSLALAPAAIADNRQIEQLRSQTALKLVPLDPPIDVNTLNEEELIQLFFVVSTRRSYRERRAGIRSVILRQEKRLAGEEQSSAPGRL
ncbi:MAG: hypothetical protein AAGF74_09980 [Pseudomonadota bacterium]